MPKSSQGTPTTTCGHPERWAILDLWFLDWLPTLEKSRVERTTFLTLDGQLPLSTPLSSQVLTRQFSVAPLSPGRAGSYFFVTTPCLSGRKTRRVAFAKPKETGQKPPAHLETAAQTQLGYGSIPPPHPQSCEQ